MGGNFDTLDVSRVVYLVLYLLLVVMGLRGMPSVMRRQAPPPCCKACETPIDPSTAPRGPWGGWICAGCGGNVDPAPEPAARAGLRGWMDLHPWAVYGAIWAGLVWILLMARDWWLGEPGPGLLTFPLTLVAGLAVGWALTLMQGRRD